MKQHRFHYRLMIAFGVVLSALISVMGSVQATMPVNGDESSLATNPEYNDPEVRRPVWITIFVHGIISIKPHLTIGNLVRFLHDEIEGTPYERTVLLMRDNPFFFQNQPMQQRGLIPITRAPLQRGAGASVMAYVNDAVEKASQGESPTENYYYTFGWSGIMSYKSRYQEATNFYNNLIELRDQFRAQGMEPHFRIEAYSHGGQVALLLGKVRQEEEVDKSLRIEETLLFGMPVHATTSSLINDPLFTRIYHIYSPGDRIQSLDIFTEDELASRQTFRRTHIDGAQRKLIQVEIRVIRKARNSRSRCNNGETYYAGPHKSYSIRDVSPGHTELWFFGWTPLHYRKTFPLYPLPIVAFSPYIVNSIRPFENTLDPVIPIVMTLDPENHRAFIKNKNEKDFKTIPFLDPEVWNDIRSDILEYAPPQLSSGMYNYHIQVAFDEAHLWHDQKQKDKKKTCKP